MDQAQMMEVLGISQEELDSIIKYEVEEDEFSELVEVLHRQIKDDALPRVIRRPDSWLGGNSILETLQGPRGISKVSQYLMKLFCYGGS